ncbi:MAG: sodium:solute symporter family protein, partial [Dehalococcoidales bacterium]|nr:sodium:solute symporter family protein [Dehalococcoidales bacterium]
MLQLIIIAAYFLVMIIIGIVSRRPAQDVDGFFVASRRGSTLFITGSLVATIIGGSATVGLAGLGFTRGLTGVWWLLVASIGLTVLGLFFASTVRKFALYTLPELIEKQYDSRVGLAASILIVVAWLGVIAGQIVAAGKILSSSGIGGPTLWMVLFSAVFVFYTALGGQHADIRTDLLQAALIFAGIFASLPILMARLGGLTGLTSSLAAGKFVFPLSPEFSGYDLISTLLLVGLTYVVGPDMYSRIFSARDGKTARASALWSALIIIPFAFVVTLIGMGAAVLFPQISPEQAFPMVATTVLPPLLGGLVLAGLVSATMSSADSCLLSASTILTVDIVKKLKPSLSERSVLLIARCGIVTLGLLSLLLAINLSGVISALLFAYTVFTSGVILPVLAGFYRSRLKVTPRGALAATIGGGLTGLVSKLPSIANVSGIPIIGELATISRLDLWALAVSAILLFLVS